MSDRFLAEGRHVYDSRRPDVSAPFPDRDIATRAARLLNLGEAQPGQYSWWKQSA